MNIDPYLAAYTAPLMADGVLEVGINGLRRWEQRMIRRAVAVTDPLLPQRIVITDNPEAEILFRRGNPARMVQAGVPSGVRGVAEPTAGRWTLLLARPISRPLQRYVVLHELGHALGLGHPFGADPFAPTAPTTDQTVMAYRLGRSLPRSWRPADRDAITGLWATPLK